MYRIISKTLLLIGVLLVLASCNLREDLLLPPNLDPKDYVTDTTVRVYSDHLIRSSNDDSYIYIRKESIADSLLWYGDVLDFKRVDSLLERDSLALPTDTQALSQSYKLSIIRSGAEVILDSIPAFATVYTDSETPRRNGLTTLLSHRYMLAAANTEVYSYGVHRCFFDLNGSGEFSLVDFPDTPQLSIPAGNTDVEALLVTGTDYLQFWIPQGFLTDMGTTTLSLEPGLEQAQVAIAQQLYPGFAVRSKVLKVQTQNSGISGSIPILHYRMPAARHFGSQWLKLGSTGVQSWESGEDTWLLEEDKLVTFINGSGSWLLIDPVEGQHSVQIALDGSYTQLFLQDLWVDLKDTQLAGHSLDIELEPSTSSLVSDYLSANPYSLGGAYSSFQLTFSANGTALETLPEDNWIEFGIPVDNARSSNRLLRAYRTADTDHLDYKTYAAEYDSGHYTLTDGYLYAGMNSSGTYIYGAITESATQTTLPCRKAKAEIQTAKTWFGWDDSALTVTSLNVQYAPAFTEQHPWLNGFPYSLNSSTAILKISAQRGSRSTDLLPANLFLSTTAGTTAQSIINFTPAADYPRFIRYRAASEFAHNTFLQSGGTLQISPAYAGYLIDASALRKTRTTADLRLYSRMLWDDYDWELLLDSSNTLSAGAAMRYTVESTLTDSYSVFASQYQFNYLSSSYKFEVQNNPGFYSSFQPFIRLRQSGRLPRQLFSVTEGDFYRIYAYPEGETADGWHFTYADGHIGFVLVHDGEFAAVDDQQPHTQIGALALNASRDLQLSLYQAQFSLPSEFIGNTVPLSTRIVLNSVPANPPGVPTLSTYSLHFLNSAQEIINPGFYALPEAPRWPYVYIPIPDYIPGQSIRLYYRNMLGITQEFTQVSAFSEVPLWEYMMVGNCAVCFVNNSGLFYTTEGSGRKLPPFPGPPPPRGY